MINYICCNPTKSKIICRDVGKSFADSLGFNAIDYRSLNLSDPDLSNGTTIVEYSWCYDYDEFNIYEFIVFMRNHPNFYIRLVDDNPSKYNDKDYEILKLIKDSGTKLITPYKITYLGFIDNQIVIPYHYEDSDEYEISNDRKDEVLLSGLINPIFYPYRYSIATNYNPNLHHIKQLTHPGYSGRLHNESWVRLGKDFIQELSLYKFMIVTADDESEVLKFVEAAEAGVVPLGYFPQSIRSKMSEQLLKLLHFDDPKELLHELKVNFKFYIDNYLSLASLYRVIMGSIRSKKSTLEIYNSL